MKSAGTSKGRDVYITTYNPFIQSLDFVRPSVHHSEKPPSKELTMRSSLLLLALSIASLTAARPNFIVPDPAQHRVQYINSKATSSSPFARLPGSNPVSIATAHLQQLNPDATFRDNGDSYTSTASGVTHVHFTQTLNGMDIANAQAKVNVKSDGTILSSGSSFVGKDLLDAAPTLAKRQAELHPVDALKSTISTLGFPMSADGATAVPKSSGGQSFTITGTSGTLKVG